MNPTMGEMANPARMAWYSRFTGNISGSFQISFIGAPFVVMWTPQPSGRRIHRTTRDPSRVRHERPRCINVPGSVMHYRSGDEWTDRFGVGGVAAGRAGGGVRQPQHQ